MEKHISIVEARRDLGGIAEEVRRSGQAIVLTRRGRAIARLAAYSTSFSPTRRTGGALAAVRGTIELRCAPEELLGAVRNLRAEFARSLERRARSSARKTRRRRG